MAAAFRPSVVLREHLRAPRHREPLAAADGHARITGSCRDTMECWLRIEAREIRAIRLVSDGCEFSHACASMTAEMALARRRVEAAMALTAEEVITALGGLPSEHEHCARLAVSTLRWACGDHIAGSEGNVKDCDDL